MDRVSDIYKNKIQIISLVIGLVLALVLNVDSLQLLKAFWEDPALRQSVAETAKNSVPVLEQQINQANQAQSNAQSQAQGTGTSAAVEQSAAEVQQSVQQLLDLQIPIGWEFTPVTDNLIAASQTTGLSDPRQNLRNIWNMLPGNNPDWLGNILRKVIGLVVTMIAVAQGAPFWFDLLRRITGGGSSNQAPPVNVTVNTPGFQG
jgi:sulfite reductase alpha subunit-like flavoprotein